MAYCAANIAIGGQKCNGYFIRGIKLTVQEF